MARATLGFGDFAGGHLVGNVGAAMGRFLVTARGGLATVTQDELQNTYQRADRTVARR